jgi:hypothetical protein
LLVKEFTFLFANITSPTLWAFGSGSAFWKHPKFHLDLDGGITSFRDMRKKEKKLSHAALGGIFVEVV